LTEHNENIWTVPNSNDIRPYGIILKDKMAHLATDKPVNITLFWRSGSDMDLYA